MLHYCSVGPGSLKVGLSPGSDRIADDSANPDRAISGPSAAGLGASQKPDLLPFKRCEHCFCLFQVRSVEALGEPAVHGGEETASFSMAALVAAEPGDA